MYAEQFASDDCTSLSSWDVGTPALSPAEKSSLCSVSRMASTASSTDDSSGAIPFRTCLSTSDKDSRTHSAPSVGKEEEEEASRIIRSMPARKRLRQFTIETLRFWKGNIND